MCQNVVRVTFNRNAGNTIRTIYAYDVKRVWLKTRQLAEKSRGFFFFCYTPQHNIYDNIVSFDHRRSIVLAVHTFPAIMAVRSGPRTRVENERTGAHPFFGPFIVGQSVASEFRRVYRRRCFRCTIVPCRCRLSRFCAVNIPPRSARPQKIDVSNTFRAIWFFVFLVFGTNPRVKHAFKYVQRK